MSNGKHFHVERTNSGKITNYSLLTVCVRLLEHRGLRFRLLKSIFKAENVECWSF